MRTAALAALTIFALASPASAQMCGGGQQAQASTPATSGGMMCGGTGAAADDPMADKPAQQQRSGMCSCCQRMSMMRGMGGMQHNMPSMDMPKQ